MARRPCKWSRDIGEIVEETKGDIRRVALATGLEAFSRLVISSPVDTGRFRGNWMIAIDSEPTGFNENAFDKTGAATIATGQANALQFKTGDTFKIRNNLVYAVPLEYGHSKQAPAGMVRQTAAELPEIVRNTAAGLAATG